MTTVTRRSPRLVQRHTEGHLPLESEERRGIINTGDLHSTEATRPLVEDLLCLNEDRGTDGVPEDPSVSATRETDMHSHPRDRSSPV